MQLDTLLAEYKILSVALPEAENLAQKRSEAQTWKQHAADVLAHGPEEDNISACEVSRCQITGYSLLEIVVHKFHQCSAWKS